MQVLQSDWLRYSKLNPRYSPSGDEKRSNAELFGQKQYICFVIRGKCEKLSLLSNMRFCLTNVILMYAVSSRPALTVLG